MLSFVEDYEQKNLLKNTLGFKNAFSYLNSSSTLFLYTDVHKFYSLLKPMMNTATWNEIRANKEVFIHFLQTSRHKNASVHSFALFP